MTEEKIHNDRSGSWWALSPLFVFLCLYLVTSILVNDFYKVPITVAFLVSSCYAIAITRGLTLDAAKCMIWDALSGTSDACWRRRCMSGRHSLWPWTGAGTSWLRTAGRGGPLWRTWPVIRTNLST